MGRHIIYTKLKGSIYYDVSPFFSSDVYVIPSTSITHPTTLAMIYVLHPPSLLPPSLPILLYLRPIQRKEEEDFFMVTSLISTSSPILLLLQTQFLNIPPFHLPKPREAAGSCNIYTFYLSLPFHLLDNFR